MAGIGFELNKILYKGTLSSIFKVFILGAVIVAGPWILSVTSIYIIQKYAYKSIAENSSLFTITIVYIYAFSLIFYGGIHYLFSRYIADMLFIKENKKIPSALVTCFILVIISAGIISTTFINIIKLPELKYPFIYKLSSVTLFITANLLWIMLVYVALLKAYYKIFMAYFIGTITSIVSVIYMGKYFSVGGALLGYSLGQVVITLILIIVSNKSYKIKIFTFNKEFITYFKKFRHLFFIGLLFNLGIWIDKIIYWFSYGENLTGTNFYYYPAYDIPVFISFMFTIPGLIYFLVITEPLFHRSYTRFIKTIMKDTISAIEENKQNMIDSLKIGLSKLIIFQLIFTIAIIFNIKDITDMLGYKNLKTDILSIVMVGVFFHMLLMTLQVYLMYLELRKEAVVSTIIYASSNLIITLLFIALGYHKPGVSYLCGVFLSTLYSAYGLIKRVPMIDFIIYNRD